MILEPAALALRVGISIPEIEARCTPFRSSTREVLVRGLGWLAVTDAEAEILRLRVVAIPAPIPPLKRTKDTAAESGRTDE